MNVRLPLSKAQICHLRPAIGPRQPQVQDGLFNYVRSHAPKTCTRIKRESGGVNCE